MAAPRSYKKRPQARRTRRTASKSRPRPLPGWLWLLIGLAIGLLVALLVWLWRPASTPVPVSAAVKKAAPATSAPAASARQEARGVKKPTEAKAPDKPERKLAFDFYTLLPEMEVLVPDPLPAQDRHQPPPAVAAGSYIVQAGAFGALKDADARKAELALLGMVSSIQVVTIDENTIHRVRIGPIDDMARLDQVRKTLQDNDIQFMLLRERGQ